MLSNMLACMSMDSPAWPSHSSMPRPDLIVFNANNILYGRMFAMDLHKTFSQPVRELKDRYHHSHFMDEDTELKCARDYVGKLSIADP